MNRAMHSLRTITALAMTTLLAACSWFGDDSSDTERAARVTSMETRAPAPPPPPPAGETLEERRLRDVYDQQADLYERLAAEGHDLDDPEYDRLLREVLTEYQSFLSAHPESLYGWILYGKMLRDVGERDEANRAFVKANTLDRNVAVVKQQIGNYLAEEGEPTVALAYYMSAVDLAPGEPIYNYQVGELLHTFRNEFIAEGALEEAMLEQQMIEAFARAHLLDPGNRRLKQRYAEAFFDLSRPNWDAALKLWQELVQTASEPVERQWATLQEARVLIAMGRTNEARHALNNVTLTSLQDARAQLLQSIEA